jgi:beta-fructofuranosidase
VASVLELPDSWVWDSWVVDDGERFHVFFLFASRAIGDPELRHRRASIGHAVSDDLRTWQRLPDALVRADAPAIDDVATWTGCTIRGDDGRWYLFYTAVGDVPVVATQQIAVAVSDDLLAWDRLDITVRADPRWYATGAATGAEPFRDPWVWKHDDGRWHMLLTASAPDAAPGDEGLVGHAVSDDLLHWSVESPILDARAGFGQLEVTQPVVRDGELFLIFSCLPHELSDRRRKRSPTSGMWAARMAGPLGPVDIAGAREITDHALYAGRAVRDRGGEWVLIPFENASPDGFVGRLADPIPLRPLLDAVFPPAVQETSIVTIP